MVRFAFIILALATPFLFGLPVMGAEQIVYASLESGQPSPEAAQLHLPENLATRAPIVVMVSGTGGIDKRFPFHRQSLLAAGIGTLELDLKSGLFTSFRDRPKREFFVPYVLGALEAVRSHPRVEPGLIAVMGFSFGAGIALLTANMNLTDDWFKGQPGFAAHIGLYAGCGMGRRFRPSGAPILVLNGTADTYLKSRRYYCSDLARQYSKMIQVVEYPDVHHGFDHPLLDAVYRNGRRIMKWDENAAMDARRRIAAFLKHSFER